MERARFLRKNFLKKALLGKGLILFLLITFFIQGGVFKEDLLKVFTYRNLGPYRVGSWISSIAVPHSKSPKYKYTFYVGSRNGGVWKTVNNGTTFFPIFENYGSL